MSTLVAAVGTDTYGGLNGFKRPVQGNPTRVPGNQPAFRGVINKPGSPIRAPAIKSSANHPDRKTNVLIPYARHVPVQGIADVGRLSPGDVAFVSKTRPGVPGYAHSNLTRLLGVDALNRFMGPDYWDSMVENGTTHRYLLVNSDNVADDWRAVPSLQEWSLDGIVLSNEDKETFYTYSHAAREGQLFNIGIQGPCVVNNGYVEERESMDKLTRSQTGQVARQTSLFAPGYMDHRVEMYGNDKATLEQQWDFQADYRGPQYHLYPLQMFDRDVRPMHDLYIGLVCTEYRYGPQEKELVRLLGYAEATRKAVKDGNPELYRKYQLAKKSGTLKMAVRSKTAYEKMGWCDGDGNLKRNSKGVEAPSSFSSFRYALFTSSQAWELADGVDIMAPSGEPAVRTKRQRLGNDPWDDEKMRLNDFKRMVGAWHVGQVLDMKAGKMPYTEGGPAETGYRVTANLNIGWCDWRDLRRKFSPAGSKDQFGDLLSGARAWKERSSMTETQKAAQLVQEQTFVQWPTLWDDKAYENVNATDDPGAYEENVNAPINYVKLELASASDINNYDLDKEEKAARLAYSNARYGDSQVEIELGNLGEDLFARRVGNLLPLPDIAGDDDRDGHMRRFEVTMANIELLLSPATADELAGASVPRPQVANYVTVAPAPPATNSTPAASVTAPLRRRAGNTPEASPDRTGQVGASTVGVDASLVASEAPVLAPVIETPVIETPVPAQAPAQAPVIEAPSAPSSASAASGRKRRPQGSEDVFSSIFGSSDAVGSSAPQPLNPAHRSAPAAPGASTGRSYQRRGKGGTGGSSSKD